MIIKNDQPTRTFQWPRRLWLTPVLILGAAAVFWIARQERSGHKEAPPLLYCDAETVENGQFVNGDRRFSNGQTQSADYARSGRYASKLAPGQGARFGLSYDWLDFEPGARYEVSVWRRQFGASTGHLVVSGDGPAAFYQTVSQPAEPNPGGWEQLRLQFALPPGDGLEKVNIHVHTSDPDSVYFDDLKLVRLAPANYQTFSPRRLYLQVEREGMNKLEQKRQEALAKGILETADDDWVEARFREEDQEPIPVKVRLKGDWLDHLRGDKWSFRINCKAGYSWNRLTTFSLHTPAARYFLHEWLLHQLWEKEDVLTSRYDFVELFLNGRSLGVYAWEEHFEKQLVEYRRRREGPILKFSEAGFWAGIARQLQNHGFIRPGSGHTSMNWENAPIEAFNENDLPENPLLQEQFFAASQRLDQFQRGAYQASDLFDIDLTAKYFAISDLLRAWHGVAWHNQRFYYNPVTDRLEPIGFDGFGEGPETKYTFLGEGALHPQSPLYETFFSYVFQDTAIAARYIQYLERYTRPDYLPAFLDSLSGEWNRRLAYLQQEFPDYRPNLDEFPEQARYIRSLLLPYDQFSLKARTIDQEGDRKRIEVFNTHSLPLEIVGYGALEAAPQHIWEERLLAPAATPRALLARTRLTDGRINDWSQLKYIGEESRISQGLPLRDTLSLRADARFVFYRALGLPQVFRTAIAPRSTGEPSAARWLDQGAALQAHPAYEITGKAIHFKPGKHRITADLFFPSGYTLHLSAGTELDLTAGAAIISRSPVEVVGSEERPVHIHSSDGSGQGLILMQAQGLSSFTYAVFASLNAAQRGSWQMTGAVTVNESNVRFRHCAFQDMKSEDALNLIRSNFQLDDCSFADNQSDGLDSDFCKGEIKNSRFNRMVNDGLDLSGSIVEISGCYFEDCGDKGISIGEESDVTVIDARIAGAPIAVACKDLSTAYLRNMDIRRCRQGFVAFQKKPEFGPGHLFVESYQAEDVDKLYNIAPGSSLQLGDRLIR